MTRFHPRGRQHFPAGYARPFADPRGARKPLDDAGPALGLGVSAPEEIVKVLVIVAVSLRRRTLDR
jgi:hypothetical protein